MPATTALEPTTFTGAFVSADDYADAQGYQIAMQRAGARDLLGSGLLDGLACAIDPAIGRVRIEPGMAVDGLGRFLVLSEPTLVDMPPGRPASLTITYSETATRSGSSAVGEILEKPAIAWIAGRAPPQPSITLVLGFWDGTTLLGSGRRYAGASAGSLTFGSPSSPAEARIVGWSLDSEIGLRIDADVEIDGFDPTSPGHLTVEGGTLGIGTMAPGAYVDVLASDVALPGPGLLTSYDTLLHATDPRVFALLHVGDTLMVTDRDGQPAESDITIIDEEAKVILTSHALHCVDAPFTYMQALIVAIGDADGRTALAIDRTANVGFGIDRPTARLHVGRGGLALSGPDRVIALGANGGIAAADGSGTILFRTAQAAMEISGHGDIVWQPGQGSSTKAPVGMILTGADQNVGIGTMSPAARLDVVGSVLLAGGGTLVFPDGSIQASGAISVPIGAIIDWWRASASQPVPQDYQICEGGDVAGQSRLAGLEVPDLRNRFVFGVSKPEDALTTIGADAHAHTCSVPAHGHPFPHTHPAIDGGTDAAAPTYGYDMRTGDTAVAVASHTHAWQARVLSTTMTTTGANAIGDPKSETDTASTLPPYIGLLKLMRIR